jgi:hypothetical protein
VVINSAVVSRGEICKLLSWKRLRYCKGLERARISHQTAMHPGEVVINSEFGFVSRVASWSWCVLRGGE